MLGRDRDRLAEAKRIGIEHARFGGAALGLVGEQDHGPPGFAQEVGKGPIERGRAGAGIDEKERHVRGRDGGLGLRLHAAGKAVGGSLLEPCGIDHRESQIAELRPPLAAIAGDTGLVVDQSQAAPDEAIEQGRLADIRPAHDGDREAHGRLPRAIE